MKRLQMIGRLKGGGWVWVAVLSLGIFCGCGGGSGEAQRALDEGLPPEGVALREAFASESPSRKAPVNEMLELVKVGSTNRMAYRDVLPQLERLGTNPTLSAEQKQAVEGLIQRIKSELAGARR